MAVEDACEVLEYLKKEKEANTFRLARELGIPRDKVIKITSDLEKKGVVEIKCGKVIFLKFGAEEKKAIKESTEIYIKSASKPKIHKKKVNAKKSKVLENLKAENKKLAGDIEKLQSTIEELRKKAKAPQKVITKTIIRKVPVEAKPKIIIGTIIKKVAIPIKPKKKAKKAPKAKKKSEKIKKVFNIKENIEKIKKSFKIKKKKKAKKTVLKKKAPKKTKKSIKKLGWGWLKKKFQSNVKKLKS